jgi:hypothetical protein
MILLSCCSDKQFQEDLSFSAHNFCSSLPDFKDFIVLKLFSSYNVLIWDYAFILLVSYLLHIINHILEGVIVISHFLLLLFGANEYELRVVLSRSSLHLDESFDCEEFVKTDDLVA